MATLTSTQANDTFPTHGTGPAGNLKVAYGTYAFTDAGVGVGDVIEMCKVPAGAVVLRDDAIVRLGGDGRDARGRPGQARHPGHLARDDPAEAECGAG